MQLQIDRFVKLMAVAGVIAFMIVWILNYLDSGDVLHSLMHGLTLAMAILPEEIPVALSTFMALGAYHLIKTISLQNSRRQWKCLVLLQSFALTKQEQ